MPETVIVTIIYEDQNGSEYRGDFELPLMSPFASYQESLENALRASFPNMIFNGRHATLQYNNEAIEPEDSLATFGAYDGSELKVMLF